MLVTDVPNNGSAEVTVPDYEELDQTSVRLAEIKVSLSTATINPVKRALPALPIVIAVLKVLGRYIARHAIRYIKKKIKEESKEAAVSLAKRLACEVWYAHDNGINTNTLPPCPCNTDQMGSDDRYTKENIIHFLINRKVFQKSKASSCYRQASVG